MQMTKTKRQHALLNAKTLLGRRIELCFAPMASVL